MRYDSFICMAVVHTPVCWDLWDLPIMCGMTHSCVKDMCEIRLIRLRSCDETHNVETFEPSHSYVWHDSFVCGTAFAGKVKCDWFTCTKMQVLFEIMVQIKQKRGIGVENPSPRSFSGGGRCDWFTCTKMQVLFEIMVQIKLIRSVRRGVFTCAAAVRITLEWYVAFIWVTWLIRNVRHDLLTCAAVVRSTTCDMSYSYVWHDSFLCVTRLIRNVRHDSFTCAAAVRTTTCDVSHSYMLHDSFVMWTMTRSPVLLQYAAK